MPFHSFPPKTFLSYIDVIINAEHYINFSTNKYEFLALTKLQKPNYHRNNSKVGGEEHCHQNY